MLGDVRELPILNWYCGKRAVLIGDMILTKLIPL